MSQHIKNVAKVPSDLHPYALDPMGKGAAITDASLGLEAIHVGMEAIFRAEAEIADKAKLHPHMLDTSQNILRHAGSAAKRIDAHIAKLEKKLGDALVLPPEHQKYAAQILDYLGKQKSPVTLAISAANKGDLSLARVLIDAPPYLTGATPEQKAELKNITLMLALPNEHAEFENAVKAKDKLQRGIQFVIDETAKRNRAWAGHTSHVDDLKNVKLVGKFNKVADEVSP